MEPYWEVFMSDEIYMSGKEEEYLKAFEGQEADIYGIGYANIVVVDQADKHGADISWYPDTMTRFHRVKIFLPREAFVAGIRVYEFGDRPMLFVKSEWHRKLYTTNFSIFAMIDVRGMSSALRAGAVTPGMLLDLRSQIDEVASRYPGVSFVSFADSILLKTHWVPGYVRDGVKNTYEPEQVFLLFQEIREVFRTVLGLQVYGVFAQGANAFYEDPLHHISEVGNHISLNSLGLPFAQIQKIEDAARQAIRDKLHDGHEVYIDGDLFLSLRFSEFEARDHWPSMKYQPKLYPGEADYYFGDCDQLVAQLEI